MYNSKLAFNAEQTQVIIRKIGMIDAFKGKWDNIENKNDRYLKELRKIATVESIGSSTRIEGAVLTDEEVRDLISNIKTASFKNRDEQEVFGYYEALDIILENAASIQLSEAYIKQLHSIQLKYSSKDKRHKGEYKNLPNTVVANYPDGSQRTIFNTTPPHLTQKEMQEMIDWINMELNKQVMHPLIVIALFVYEFLSIHPFQDGNGRLSRLLTTLLLLKCGYEFAQYISFEHIIELRKSEYYSVLMLTQQNRGTDKEIIGDWVLFFLDSLQTLTQRLEQKYAAYKEKGSYVNERQKRIIEYIEKKQPVKLGDIHLYYNDVSIHTLKKDLQYLAEQKLIMKTGEKKGTVYMMIAAKDDIAL